MQRLETLFDTWSNGQRGVCIACLGDSVTAGYTSAGVVDHEGVYHARLKRMLHERWPLMVVNVINAGVAGDTIKGGLVRLQRDALVHQPDLLVIAFGLNDASAMREGIQTFATNLTQAIHQARAAGVLRIILVTPPMMATADNPNIHPSNRNSLERILLRQNTGVLSHYAQTIRDVAHQLGVPVADVHAQWQAMAQAGIDTNAMLANGLNHPTSDAHQIHADALMEQLMTM